MRFNLFAGSRRREPRTYASLAFLVLTIHLVGLTGCLAPSPLAKPAEDFSQATASVVQKSENAYQAANRLSFDEQVSMAALNYDTDPTWTPRKLKPLLTPEQLAVRTTLLDALKAYAEDVDAVANMKGGSNLDSTSTAIGNSLVSLSTSLATDTGRTSLGLPQSNANYLSTSVNALGQYLIERKIRKNLGPKIIAMDPSIKQICFVLQIDIGALQSQAKYDYSNLLSQQDLFIRNSIDKLSPEEHRAEIHRLATIYEKSQSADKILGGLKDSIGKLGEAHHALAETAGGGDPARLSARLADLTASAQSLATYYESLPVPTS